MTKGKEGLCSLSVINGKTPFLTMVTPLATEQCESCLSLIISSLGSTPCMPLMITKIEKSCGNGCVPFPTFPGFWGDTST